MCGIGGILRVHPPGSLPPPPEVAIPEAWLDLIDESIKHRGPDGKGRFRDRALRPDGSIVDVAFVHRRLSIIDHTGGHQPMVQGGIALLSGDEGDYRLVPCHVCPKCQELAEKTGARTQSVSDGLLRSDHNRARPGPISTLADSTAPAPNSDLLAVVFNGCIYNHRELRKELQAAGHVFATDHSDTEVLLHGWAERQIDILHDLRGMFALSIWDGARGQMLLARDFAGEKPLYLARPPTEDGTWLVFASTLPPVARVLEAICPDPAPIIGRSLRRRAATLAEQGVVPGNEPQFSHVAPGILGLPTTRVDLRGIEASFVKRRLDNPFNGRWDLRADPWTRFGYSEYTPFRLIAQVRPGNRILACQSTEGWESHGAFLTPWSEWIGSGRRRPLNLELAEQLIRASVSSRLEADVPLGSMLSGGVDSSLVSLFAQQELQRSERRLKTFTVRMPDPRFNETPYAEAVAAQLGTDHTTLPCEASASADLIRLIETLGLPFGDSSLLPAYWVARAMRAHVTVAIGGDGGDELFLGYERYEAARWLHSLGRLGRALGYVPLPHGPAKSKREKVRRLLNGARVGRYDEFVAIFESTDFQRLTGRRCPTLSVGTGFQRPQIVDFHTYLPDDLLRKSDTASMAAGLELRSPLLDFELVRCAMATPDDVLAPHHQRKGLLRAVARKYFPKEIVDRPKQGFAIPIGEWFRSDYGGLKTLLLDHLNSTEPWGSPSLGIDLNMKFVRQMLDEHLGTGPSGLVKRDHSQRLYMLLVLSIWAKWLSGL